MFTTTVIWLIIIALYGWSGECYKFLLHYCKNEYFSELLVWAMRVFVVIFMFSGMVDYHYNIMQFLLWLHIIEGSLLLLILTPFVRLLIGKTYENK